MKLERLSPGHVVAAVAALALLLVMATDWYGSHEADRARQIGNSANVGGEEGQSVKEDADRIIARDEKNAWQEQDTLDRVLLALLLLSVFLPLVAAAHRAAGRRSTPPWTWSAFAALTAAAAALLLAYRLVDKPGDDTSTTIKIGALLGLGLLAVIGLGAAAAVQQEAEREALRQTATDGAADTPTRGQRPA